MVAVDRRGHKRDREDAAVLSRPVRVGDGGDGDGGAKGWVVRLKYLSVFFIFFSFHDKSNCVYSTILNLCMWRLRAIANLHPV